MRTIIDGLAFAKAVAHVSKTLIAGQRQAVRLAATGDGLRLDADGQYYSRADLDAETVEDGSADMDALVPAAWLKANAEGADRIGATGRMFAIAGPVYTDATPMVEGQAPELAAIWPSKDAPLTLTMDRAELLEAARRVKAVKFSGGETVTLALAVGDDSITLGLDDAESGSGARQTVSAEVSGPVSDGHVEGADRRLRLDARYVANACGALYGDRVTMYIAPRSNGRYKPVLLACPDAPDGFDMRDEQLIVPILL